MPSTAAILLIHCSVRSEGRRLPSSLIVPLGSGCAERGPGAPPQFQAAALAGMLLRGKGQNCVGVRAAAGRARALWCVAGFPTRRGIRRRWADASLALHAPVRLVRYPAAPKAARAAAPNGVPDAPPCDFLPAFPVMVRVVLGPSLLLNGMCAAKVPHAAAGSHATARGPAQCVI